MNEDSDSQDILTIQAPIQAVTVFHRGALVQRRAELRAPTSRLLVQGLPLCLDDATLVARIEGKGAPAVTDLRAALQVTDVDRQAPPEQAAVDAAASAVRRARDQVERLEARLQDLDTLSSPDRPVAKRGRPAPAVPTDARLALLAFRAKALDKTSESIAMASDALRRAEEEHRALQDALRRASTAREPRAQELRKAAHLTLVGLGEGAGPWTLHLEYLVPGARWSPIYLLELDAELATLRLHLRATVAQRTGEDWKGVALTLSSAQPLGWTDLPELPARRIGRRQPPKPRRGWKPAPTGADALYADFDQARVRLLPPDKNEEIPLRRGKKLAAAPQPQAPAAPSPVSSPAVAAAAAELPVRAPSSRSGPRRRSRAVSVDLESFGAPIPADSSVPAAKERPVLPAEIRAPKDLLDYGRLRLAGPDQSDHGRLRPAAQLQLYTETLTVQQVQLTRQTLGLLVQAVDRARMPDLALPPGQREPAPVSDFDHAWRTDHPVDIDSDGGWHALGLHQADASARQRFVVVPREARQVFRFLTFDNPLDGPLPAGPADVFVGGSLLLTTPLAATDRGRPVKLGLGVEEGIRVARNSRYEERSTGLLGGGLALEHHVEITLANTRSVPASVDVRERVPVAREDDDDVQVRAVSADPPWKPFEQPDQPVEGAFHWQLELGPGAEQTLHASYTVEIPSKRELVGGNRRER